VHREFRESARIDRHRPLRSGKLVQFRQTPA
jgi:hypothetical protein